MKRKFSILFFVSVIATAISAQELSQITFSQGTTLTSFAFMTEQGVLIRISEEGQLLEYGIEVKAMRSDYYAPRLQPFSGRIDFYGAEADSVSKGKVKMIGTTTITYYGPFENQTHVGKVKSVGTAILDYFSPYDNKLFRGKLKNVGSYQVEYYSAFENEAFRGKLKSVGSTQITYYSAFDDRMNIGKVKSIGPVKYSWYSSFDRRDMGGALKSGLYRQRINGITYILW